mmetsp:Transcript_12009/g.22540  ORF Transcript_12009/g.22540 Transcript_12009/m.22540 type:complete len:224 (+) Transcript_12009:1006-1677(+)
MFKSCMAERASTIPPKRWRISFVAKGRRRRRRRRRRGRSTTCAGCSFPSCPIRCGGKSPRGICCGRTAVAAASTGTPEERFERRRDDDDDESNSVNHQNKKLELGAFQENKSIAPLSTWTLESAYTSSNSDNDMMEFVVDEEDLFPGLSAEDATVWKVLDGSVVGYGSRQVGGGKGPGNPHGEESELLYYVDRRVVEGKYWLESKGLEVEVNIVVNPNLEHLW